MGWLIALFARLALLFVWIWTPLVNRAFQGDLLLPLLGILFLPLTTLVYILVYIPGSGVIGWGWLWVVLALLLDLGVHSSSMHTNRYRFPVYKDSREQRDEKAY
jgi:uncharacterized membrane protein